MFRTLTSLLVIAGAVAYGFGIWLFVLRAEDILPAHADAIVVLAGSRARLPVALKLANAGLARTLVVSLDDSNDDPARAALCTGPKPVKYTLLCEVPSPSSTRGEARLIAGLAAERRWKTVVVVTSRYHLYRARVLIRRCTKVDISMRATDGDTWWQKAVAIPLEYAKLARADTLQRGC